MAKRKSWDDKNKHIHPTRKKIIDTVFGREDNTQKVFGYEGEAEKRREIGERWTDKDGKEWEQKEGYKVAVSKFEEIKEYLKQITNCSTEECKTGKYSKADKKAIARTGMCLDCLQKYEQGLKNDGTWPYYEDYKITNNKLSWIREFKDKCEDSLLAIKNNFEMVNEDGSISKWTWEVDINKVKEDLKSDIKNSYDAIDLLIQRKTEIEKKLLELNHPELIK